MSSISGSNPLINTNIPTSNVGTTTGTTQTTNTAPLYGDLGNPQMSVDMLGIVKPNSPEDSSALLQEILEAVETLVDKSRGQQLENIASALRNAISDMAVSIAKMEAAAIKIESNTKLLADINKLSFNNNTQTAQGYFTTSMTNANYWIGQRDTNNQLAGTAWSNYSSLYQAEMSKPEDKRDFTAANAQLSNYYYYSGQASSAQGHADYWQGQANMAADAANTWLNGQGLGVTQGGMSRQDFNTAIMTATNTQKQSLGSDSDTQKSTYDLAQTTLLNTFLIISSAVKQLANDVYFVGMAVDANFAELGDLIQDNVSDIKGITSSSFGGEIAGTNGSKVNGLVAALVSGLADILSAIGALSDLASVGAPGMDSTNSRFRVAI